MIHLIIGILAAIILWKLIKGVFKLLLWLIPIALIGFFIFPHLFMFVGGIGLFVLGLLGALLLIGLAGLLFSFDND